MVDFPIILEDRPDVPLYQQLCDALRKGIIAGHLKPGQAMPSSRTLSSKLGISRFTVTRSFELLLSQGYLESAQGAGTYVSKNLPGNLPEDLHVGSFEEEPAHDLDLSDFTYRVLKEENVWLPGELNYAAPAIEHLPYKQWRQLMLKNLREPEEILGHVNHPLGQENLRTAIAGYLSRSRSVNCQPDQVVIFAGPMASIDFIARVLINEGDVVAAENPGFRHARRMFAAHGAKVVPVPVDEEGLKVSELDEIEQKPKLICVTPSHHDPTGVVLSSARRIDLLEWAKRNGSIIVEDDFDHEYRYASRPVPALQALDKAGNVIYTASLWRVIFPLARITFAVFPQRLMNTVLRIREMLERDVPTLEQNTLAELINEGVLERHIRSMKPVYGSRRQALIEALVKNFGAKVWMFRESAGMHVLVRFRANVEDQTIIDAAQKVDFPLVSTAAYYIENPIKNEFIVPFGHLKEADIADGISRLAQELAL